MKDDYIGKTIQTGQEWYCGEVYYEDVYKKNGKYYGTRKVMYNSYSKRVEEVIKDVEVFVPFGFEVVEPIDLLSYSI